ncbi:unnamed protein product [Taenia asiatica]|uniref:Small proline-rich protein 3 n=1 Tax=Taenia asiatica TaxID=60517 RepID=A0A0R3W374_TAEAS|nr:unnamed protein product [Taenia asiatica]
MSGASSSNQCNGQSCCGQSQCVTSFCTPSLTTGCTPQRRVTGVLMPTFAGGKHMCLKPSLSCGVYGNPLPCQSEKLDECQVEEKKPAKKECPPPAEKDPCAPAKRQEPCPPKYPGLEKCGANRPPPPQKKASPPRKECPSPKPASPSKGKCPPVQCPQPAAKDKCASQKTTAKPKCSPQPSPAKQCEKRNTGALKQCGAPERASPTRSSVAESPISPMNRVCSPPNYQVCAPSRAEDPRVNKTCPPTTYVPQMDYCADKKKDNRQSPMSSECVIATPPPPDMRCITEEVNRRIMQLGKECSANSGMSKTPPTKPQHACETYSLGAAACPEAQSAPQMCQQMSGRQTPTNNPCQPKPADNCAPQRSQQSNQWGMDNCPPQRSPNNRSPSPRSNNNTQYEDDNGVTDNSYCWK